jgi:peptide/nickel transport system permease protein
MNSLAQAPLAQRLPLAWGQWAAILALVALALFASLSPWLLPDPYRQDLGAILQPPSATHWLGTDAYGRSALARLAEGTRVSLLLALGSALAAALLGTLLGLLAAWRRGVPDRALQGLGDAVMALPALLWVLLLSALAPGEKWPLYMGLVLTAWVEFFRTTRASVGAVLAGPQVQASRLLGFGPVYIVRHHLWPDIRPTTTALTAFAVCNAVLAVAAMGFVGIGLRPPGAELGLLMTESLPYSDDAPQLLLAPVLVLLVCVAALQALARTGEAP